MTHVCNCDLIKPKTCKFESNVLYTYIIRSNGVTLSPLLEGFQAA